VYEASNQTDVNWTMWSQTNICITKLSCVDRWDNRAWHKLTQFSFFGLCPSSNFLEQLDGLEAGTVSIFRQRST